MMAPVASLALPFALSSAPSPLSWLLLFLPMLFRSFRYTHFNTYFFVCLSLRRVNGLDKLRFCRTYRTTSRETALGPSARRPLESIDEPFYGNVIPVFREYRCVIRDAGANYG